MADGDPADPGGLGAERRRQRVDLRAPGDRGEAPEDGAEADGQHDHGELGLADDPPQHRRSRATAPNSADDGDGERERHPVAEAVPDHEHVAGERAEHHEVALGEVHELGGLVDEDEAEGDQAVDAPDGEPVQDQLQDDVQGAPSPLKCARL